jgi:hypothetical protein
VAEEGPQIKLEKSSSNVNNAKCISTLFNLETASYNENLFGFITEDRYKLILENIYYLIKKGLTKHERLIWALIIALQG